MRTVIYVHQPSTVTIRALAARDAGALLYRYNQDLGQVASGTHPLAAGIYMILSSGELEVSGSATEVVVLANDKDIPPDPKRAVLALEPGATVQSVRQFLIIAKDISVGDEPASEPASDPPDDPASDPAGASSSDPTDGPAGDPSVD